MNLDAAALAYVRYVMEQMQLKPGALAKGAGISASTLTRALNDPNHKFKLSTTTLQKIADFSGYNPGPFLEAKDTAQMTLNEAFREDLYKPRPNVPTVIDRGPDRKWTMIAGEAAADVWRSPEPFPYFDYGPIHITSSIRPPKDCFAFVMRDQSANMLAAEGDILFCLRIDDEWIRTMEPLHLRSGDAVLVERRSHDAFKVEHTLRYIRPRNDGWELISAREEDYAAAGASAKPKKRLLPTVELEKYEGNEEFRVIGRVEAILRDTTPAANWLLFKAKP